jgi:hypothetical protein
MTKGRQRTAGGTEKWNRLEVDDAARALLAKTHPGFKIICGECDSDAVGVTSDVGFSAVSGAWGGVTLVCSRCGFESAVWEV